MPDRANNCLPDTCDGRYEKGTNLGVYINNGSDCVQRLSRPVDIKSPSIPVQLTANIVELRDGSSDNPLKLPALQSTNAEAVPALLVMLADGTIAQWKFGNFSGAKKLVLENGSIKFADDYSSDLISSAICAETSCNQLDGLLGYKSIVHSCPGEAPRVMTQICLAPKCCCSDSDLAQDCEICEELEAIITPP